MLKSANLDGYFTNHSLRRSSTTRLFQAGHTSYAIDTYQITSNDQRKQISAVIAGENIVKSPACTISKPQEVKSCNVEVKVTDNSDVPMDCSVKEKDIKMSQSDQIGQLVSKMLEGRTSGKAKITIEIEFS